MARKRKGNPVHGWLVIDKPAGISSAGVVNKARWALRAQKAGHSGTLDPMATGCLAIAFGEATKVIPVAQEGLKTYRFTVRWGQATSTDDAEGDVIEARDQRPDREAIIAALPTFTGEITQVPPIVSAIKVEGQRSYDLAREGVAAELKARPLHVAALTLLGMEDADHASFEMVCGKGGYVRSIARDLGEHLGCLGHVTVLRRLATGPFTLDAVFDFAGLDACREADALPPLLPLEAGLADLDAVDVSEVGAADLRMGRAVAVAPQPDLARAWARHAGSAVALGRVQAGMFHPDRVLLPHAAPSDDFSGKSPQTSL
ncbi:tRNA pseudouridine(55) synthase TruB [Rhodobacteraceae bacterium NNCM2]|nr:tRNA pseudouridine(55) synthase TruB [Coraliihabitans acroporae]